jgi:hypothetical protein
MTIACGCSEGKTDDDSMTGHSEQEQSIGITETQSTIRFEEVAVARGLQLTLPEQPRPMRTIEAFGCGCASFDFNNDGWQDILIVSDPYPNLFQNQQDGTFANVTHAAGLDAIPEGNWTGCAVGDYDGDGWLDILLTGYHCLCLCRNIDGQKFKNVTADVELDPGNQQQWGAGAGFMDLDGDQWLDLVILNYVHFDSETQQFCDNGDGVQTSCPPKVYQPEYGEIHRNVGGKRFQLIPADNGMSSTNGIGLVLAFSDLDGDGKTDFYIGNDARDADLMHNQGGMQFQNAGLSSGIAMSRRSEPLAAMGADWGDYDRDGRLDLTVTDFQDKGAVLFRNLGNMVFADVSEKTGIRRATSRYLGFGLNWLDFDNDGWLDIGYVHGHVYENIADWRTDVTYKQPIALLHSKSGESFKDVLSSQNESVTRAIVGRGSASLDFDNDGRMDFLVVDYEGPVLLLQNQTDSENHWIKLNLRGRSPNTFGYGAKIRLVSGEQQWVEQVAPSSSYLSSKDPRVHLGLGQVTHIEELMIEWPSGAVQKITDVRADQILNISEPDPSVR